MKIKLFFVATFLICSSVAIGQQLVLDPDFGGDGRVQTSFGTDDSLLATLGLQADGKIIACGSYYRYDESSGANPANINQVAVARYNTDGSLDTTFGVNGKFLVPVGADTENETNNIMILNDGKILIRANNYVRRFPDFLENYVLMRYNSNGTPDTGFGTNGVLEFDFDIGEGGGSAMQVQNDNKIVICGLGLNLFPNNNDEDFAISRYNADGSKDLGFGTNGIAKINFGIASNNATRTDDGAYALKIQADGKIVAAGFTADYPEPAKFALLRLTPNGSLDPSFGINGKVISDFTADSDIAETLELLPDGKILAVGTRYFNNDDSEQILVAKYNANGTLDTSYGNGGKVMVDDGTNVQHDFAGGSKLLADGKLLITGSSDAIDSDVLLLRLNANGTQDATFGINGFLSFDAGSNGYGTDILIQPDGKIVVGGETGSETSASEFTLWRLKEADLSSTKFNNSAFSVSPNPFTNYINIDFKLAVKSYISITLTDNNGRLIGELATAKVFLTGNNSFQVNTPENLSKGVYMLNISDGKNTTTIKMIKE